MALLVITYALCAVAMIAGGVRLYTRDKVKGSARVKIGNGVYEFSGEAVLFGGGLCGVVVLTAVYGLIF